MFLGPLYDFTDNAFSVENVDIFIRLLACSNSCTAASLRAHSFPLCNLSRSRLGGAMVGPKTGRPAGAAGPASRLPSPTFSSHHRPTKTSFERWVRRTIVCRVAKPVFRITGAVPKDRNSGGQLRQFHGVNYPRIIREIQQSNKLTTDQKVCGSSPYGCGGTRTLVRPPARQRPRRAKAIFVEPRGSGDNPYGCGGTRTLVVWEARPGGCMFLNVREVTPFARLLPLDAHLIVDLRKLAKP